MFLLETLDVKFSGLVGQLYSDQVLSAVERDDISAEQTSFRANEMLLSVLSRKSSQQFQLFLDALDMCGQRHVRNVITDRPGLSIMAKKLKRKLLNIPGSMITMKVVRWVRWGLWWDGFLEKVSFEFRVE